MVRTRYVTIPSGQEDIYAAALQSGDRFTFSKITRKVTFYGRKKIAGLTRRSYIPAIAAIWRTFNAAKKADWKTAGTERGIHGWQAFVADQAKRIKFGIAGEATPVTTHQDLVGLVYITLDDTGWKLPTQSGGGDWLNEGNILLSNNQYTTTPAGSQNFTGFIWNFNFGLPANAIIIGIEVRTEWNSADGNEAKIGVTIGSSFGLEPQSAVRDIATSSQSDILSILGSSSDLWGIDWVADHFGNNSFQVQISERNGAAIPRVDNIQVKVYYKELGADEVKIAQYHPSQYWVSQKVQGHKRMYEPASVTEAFALPLELSINYKSNLVSTGAGSFAKFYAIIRHSYQGQNLTTNLDINIPLIGGWANLNDTISSVSGEVQGYDLYIHLNKVTGTLHFDNPKATHSSQNWLRDPYCKDISKSFTRAFYQVAASWQVITLPTGASFNSVYPT